MTFNSYVFILFFMPAVLAGYYYCFLKTTRRTALVFLLVASAIFYCSAGWESAFILLLSMLVNYGLFRGMRACRGHEFMGGGVNAFCGLALQPTLGY